MGVLVVDPRTLAEANGEIQIMLEIPWEAERREPSLTGVSPPPPLRGVRSLPRGRVATSVKKKLVLTVGVPGVRGIPVCGVFTIEPYPPGEKNPLAVGDCNHASTLEWSKEPVDVGGPRP